MAILGPKNLNWGAKGRKTTRKTLKNLKMGFGEPFFRYFGLKMVYNNVNLQFKCNKC